MTRAAAVVVWLLVLGCGSVDPLVTEVAENVLTLQDGTVSELKARRGDGPFTTYALPPEDMLFVVRDAAAKARGAGDHPVRAIFVSEARSEVVAKERSADDASDAGYDAPFRTAMVATVHRVRGEPGQSKVEVHAMQRGPFHRGQVMWERDMPGWIDEVIAERQAEADRVKRIP